MDLFNFPSYLCFNSECFIIYSCIVGDTECSGCEYPYEYSELRFEWNEYALVTESADESAGKSASESANTSRSSHEERATEDAG